MNNQTEAIDALRTAYAALNRNDIDGFVAYFDAEIERVEFPDSPSGGTYRGLKAVKEHVVKGRSTWAEGGCEPERFEINGNKIVVSVHVRVRLKGHAEWLDGHTIDVFTFRDGKVTEFHTFANEREALAWENEATHNRKQ